MQASTVKWRAMEKEGTGEMCDVKLRVIEAYTDAKFTLFKCWWRLSFGFSLQFCLEKDERLINFNNNQWQGSSKKKVNRFQVLLSHACTAVDVLLW